MTQHNRVANARWVCASLDPTYGYDLAQSCRSSRLRQDAVAAASTAPSAVSATPNSARACLARVVAAADVARDQRRRRARTDRRSRRRPASSPRRGRRRCSGMSWSFDRCSGIMRLAAAVHAHHVGRAVAAAPHARRAEAAVVHDERGARLAAQQLHLVVHAEAAALRARPARALAQREAREQDRDSTAPAPPPAGSWRCRWWSSRW